MKNTNCPKCEGSGSVYVATVEDGETWTRCVPCQCAEDPLIPVKASQWAKLNQCAKDLNDSKARYKNAIEDMETLIKKHNEAVDLAEKRKAAMEEWGVVKISPDATLATCDIIGAADPNREVSALQEARNFLLKSHFAH